MTARRKPRTYQPGSAFQYRNKAEWLFNQAYPDNLEFPLHAELIAAIPKDLPAKVPESEEELIDLLP